MSDLLSTLRVLGNDYAGFLALVAVVVGIYYGIPARASLQLQRLEILKTALLDHREWPDQLAALNPAPVKAYLAGIEAVLLRAEHMYGAKLLGWRAFDRALSIAFGYSITTMLTGWALFDAGSLGATEFMPPGLPLRRRLFTLLALIASGAVLFAGFRLNGWAQTAVAARLTRPRAMLAKLPGFWWRAADMALSILPWLLPMILAIVAFAGMFAVSVAIGGTVALAGTFAFALAGAFGGVVALAVALAFTLATFLGYSLMVTIGTPSEGDYFALATLLFFLTLLPILNAIADFLSIAATRHFLRKIAPNSRHPQGAAVGWVLLGVALDLAIAAACLFGLLWAMTASLDLWATVHPPTLPLDWRAYRAQICAGDLQRGTMVWLMLATTLVPTLIHLAAGLGAVFARSGHLDAQIDAILRPAHDMLQMKYKAKVWTTHSDSHGREALTTSQQDQLAQYYHQRSTRALWGFWGMMLVIGLAFILVIRALILPLATLACTA